MSDLSLMVLCAILLVSLSHLGSTCMIGHSFLAFKLSDILFIMPITVKMPTTVELSMIQVLYPWVLVILTWLI